MHRTTPVRRSFVRFVALIAALGLLAAACGDDSSGDDAAPDTSAPTETSSTTTTLPGTTAAIPDEGEALIDLQIAVVEFGDAGFVEIVNNGDADLDLNGIYSCQYPDYTDLGTVVDGGSIAAGASVQIPAAVLGGLDAADGEAALYEGDTFDSPDGMLSYVQWGAGGHRRADVAVQAGLWPSADDFVTPDPEFPNIESGGFAADPENWS